MQDLIQVIFQLAAAARMAQLAQGLGLDLPDALACDMELLTHFFKRATASIVQTEAQLQHLALSLRQAIQHILYLLLEQLVAGRVRRRQGGVVLDEVTQVAVLLFAYWRLQANRLLTDLDDLAHLLRADLHLSSDLLRRRLPTQVLQQAAADTNQAVDGFHHMHRNANRARLVSNCARDCLANPPRRVRAELVALRIIELLHGPDQTDIPLLDQVQQAHTAPDILFSNAHYQAQIRLRQASLRLLTIVDQTIIPARHRL